MKNESRIDFLPNLSRIELDITYDCNLGCINCNRSCTQSPTKEMMTLDQIKGFVLESNELGLAWEKINILGGEPTLHPDFLEIVQTILIDYIEKCSPDTILQITSHGLPRSRRIIDQLPVSDSIKIHKESFKTTKVNEGFLPFNLAPVDDDDYQNADFSKGCWVTSSCGIGLNSYGYFACAVAGGIERIFQLGQGIKSLRLVNQTILKQQLNEYCRFCGFFSACHNSNGNLPPAHEIESLTETRMSKTWVSKYESYKNNPKKIKKVYT